MPEKIQKDFTILYGSQTGQSEAISEELFDRCFQEGLSPVRFCVSQVEKKFSLEKETCVVIVCSTTGEGEPPEKALKFFRRLRKKTLPPTYLQHLSYALLGLGDSNYTNFCNASKNLEERLNALGAKSFYPSGFADDGVGLECVVEPWIEGFFPAVRKHLGITSRLEETNNTLNTALSEKIVELPTTKVSNGHCKEEVKIKGIDKITEKSETFEEAAPCLKCAIPPLCDATLKVPSLPPPYLQVKFINDEESSKSFFEYPCAATGIKEAIITSARQLTQDSMVKKALELELDVTEVGYDYQPGDSFGIVCENRKEEVDYLIQRLKIEDIADKLMTLDIMADTIKKAPSVPKHIHCPSTIRAIFRKDVDFRAVPRKAFLRMLVEYTEKESEKRRLQELCSTQGATDYSSFVREHYVGLCQLLQVFQSCSPPVERVLEMLPQLQPREYSAASSPYQNPNRVKFVFNVMELPDFQSNKRLGLCTSWLDSITESMRTKNTSIEEKIENIKLEESKVNIYFRQPTPFRFPDDPSQPLIMIGPGTGVAPYIGFLQQRDYLKRQNPSIELGSALLFYGCRYKSKDFLYREELSAFQNSGILTELYTSFSRDEPDGDGHTKYVQENIRKHNKMVMDLIFEQNGAVFICGDAKHMGRDVTNTFIELIQEYKNMDKLESMRLLNDLRGKRQFLEDTWS